MKGEVIMILEHGGDIYGDAASPILLDFSVNLNLLGMPEPVKEAAKKAVDNCAAYPDPHCRRLRDAIARREGVEADAVLCGNGAADLIYRIAFGLKPASALILAPTFSEYRQALEAAGCRVDSYLLQPGNDFLPKEDILEEIRGHDLVFLCSPNNPTGQVIPPKLLEQILYEADRAGATLAVDECFLGFLPEKDRFSLKKTNPKDHLLILKAFTKLYAMAGLRLGYLLAFDPKLREQIAMAGPPWSVSIPAQEAGLAALEQEEYENSSIELLERLRPSLARGLQSLGFQVFPSSANYLLFRSKEHTDLKKVLLRKGILIRSCANYEGLDDTYYRVAVRQEQDNQKLLTILAEILV